MGSSGCASVALRAYSFQKFPWPSLTPLIIQVAAWHISWISVSLRRSGRLQQSRNWFKDLIDATDLIRHLRPGLDPAAAIHHLPNHRLSPTVRCGRSGFRHLAPAPWYSTLPFCASSYSKWLPCLQEAEGHPKKKRKKKKRGDLSKKNVHERWRFNRALCQWFDDRYRAHLTLKDAGIVKLVKFTGELFFFRLETTTIAGCGVWEALQETPRGLTQRLPGGGRAHEGRCEMYSCKQRIR